MKPSSLGNLCCTLGCVYREDVGLRMGSQRAEPFCNGVRGVWVSTPWAERDVLGMNVHVPWEVGWEDPHPAIVGESFPFRAASGSGNLEKHGSWKHCCGEEVVLMRGLCLCRVVPRGGAPMHSNAAHLPSPPYPMPELCADGSWEEESLARRYHSQQHTPWVGASISAAWFCFLPGCAECLKLIRDEQTTRLLPNVLLAVGIGRRKVRRVSQLRTQGTVRLLPGPAALGKVLALGFRFGLTRMGSPRRCWAG